VVEASQSEEWVARTLTGKEEVAFVVYYGLGRVEGLFEDFEAVGDLVLVHKEGQSLLLGQEGVTLPQGDVIGRGVRIGIEVVDHRVGFQVRPVLLVQYDTVEIVEGVSWLQGELLISQFY